LFVETLLTKPLNHQYVGNCVTPLPIQNILQMAFTRVLLHHCSYATALTTAPLL